MAELKVVTLTKLSQYHTKSKDLFADKTVATELANGLMSAADKKKLAGIAEGAQVNSITGVKGSAEGAFRTGNVEITKANIGLDKVENSADSEKSVKSATTLTTARSFSVTGGATATAVSFNGSANVALNVTSLDATKLSGIIPVASIPPSAMERLVVVQDDVARFALTSAKVQQGDTVKVTGTGKMYFVKDDTKLNSEAGYDIYTAGAASSVPWSGITDKPKVFAPDAHTHGKSDITDFPALATVATSGKYTDLSGTPSSLPANGGNASTVGGFTVGCNVPAGAKFTDTTYSNMVGASSTVAGKSGLVPAPANGKQASFLRGDGTWAVPVNTTYSNATQSSAGLMSATDKVKLDGIVECTEGDINALFA